MCDKWGSFIFIMWLLEHSFHACFKVDLEIVQGIVAQAAMEKNSTYFSQHNETSSC